MHLFHNIPLQSNVIASWLTIEYVHSELRLLRIFQPTKSTELTFIFGRKTEGTWQLASSCYHNKKVIELSNSLRYYFDKKGNYSGLSRLLLLSPVTSFYSYTFNQEGNQINSYSTHFMLTFSATLQKSTSSWEIRRCEIEFVQVT